MAHTIRDKAKLLARVRRIEAVERALEQEKGCADVLHLVVAVRGAMNSLMAEIIEGHIRMQSWIQRASATPAGPEARRS